MARASCSNHITDWIDYFVGIVMGAQTVAEKTIQFVLTKKQFYDKFKDQMNQRQAKVIKRMLREGTSGFEGGINTRKYVAITRCAAATATRDLGDLLMKGILTKRAAGGRSTAYDVNL